MNGDRAPASGTPELWPVYLLAGMLAEQRADDDADHGEQHDGGNR